MLNAKGLLLLAAATVSGASTTDCSMLGGLPLQSSKPEVSLGANRDYANVGSSVTFTANVTGGTAPYTYFWQMDSDNDWTKGSRTYTRTMDDTGTRSVYFLARDANGEDSDIFSVQVTVLASGAPTSGASSSGGSSTSGSGSGSAGTSSALEVDLGASNKTPARGDKVTFTASVRGGTPPYKYFWWLQDDQEWTVGSASISRTINATGTVSMYFIARDAQGNESAQYGIQIDVPEPLPQYSSLAGCYNTTFGSMVLSLSGSTVTGTYTFQEGLITGTLAGHVLTGDWSEVTSSGAPDIGQFEFTFSEGWESFSGAWGRDPAASFNGTWSGSRKDCD